MRSRKIVIWLMLSLLVLLQFGCMSTPSTSKPVLILKDHPLSGKIWDVRQQTFIDQSDLIKHIVDAEYLLLGERHDNLVHHQHQAWVIKQLARSGQQVSVAFEMIDNYQAARMAGQDIMTADELIKILNRSRTNWKYEQRYKSIFTEVIAAGYRIDSANLNSKRLMHTVMNGEDQLPPAYKRMLDRTPMSEKYAQALQHEINASHCNMLDVKTSRKMILGQRLRDAIMAHSLLKSQEKTKVLIAGNGHIRNDRAVPLYLRTNLEANHKQANILTIGSIEVEADMPDISSYTKLLGGDTLPFDFVWFTPAVKRDDACEELRKHFKSKTG